MELNVHGQKMDVGDALRTHVEEKITDVSEKYLQHMTYATVTFSKEGHGHPRTKAHISLQAGKNLMIVADDIETDPYAAFDAACDKAAKQLRRYKRRIRDNHNRQEHTPEQEIIKSRDYVIKALQDNGDNDNEEASNDDPIVIAEMTNDVSTMTVSDAVMHMDLSGENTYVFRNSKNGRINIVHTRKDGNIGWIDPDNS